MKHFLKFFVIAVIVAVMAIGVSACAEGQVPATQVALDKTELIMVMGRTEQLVATVDEQATDKSIKWESSDESKIMVNAEGLLTAVDEGEAVITATTKDGSNLTATCKVYSVKTLEEKYFRQGYSQVKEIENTEVKNKTEITAYKIWYPAELENSSAKYPAVVCLNGSGCTYADSEIQYKHLASWGFVVIGNDQQMAISGKSGLESVDILKELNSTPESPLYKKINLNKIGLQGGSQGGSGAIHAALSDSPSNIFKSLMTLSAARGDAEDAAWRYDMTKIKIPCFMVSGTGFFDSSIVTSLEAMQTSFNECSGETYMARRKEADHTDMAVVADGYLTAWFLYTLTGDKEAEEVFKGENPELFNNANWTDVNKKNN